MKCYLCGSTRLNKFRTKVRFDIPRNVMKCGGCGLVFLEPQKKNLKDYYRKAYRKLYTPVLGKQLTSRQVFDIYLPFQRQRIREIRHILKPGMRALEIGCSSGHFLVALKKYVKECVGMEFNKNDAKFVREKLGIPVYTEPIEKTGLPENSFDLIVIYMVLEHIDDPIPFLKAAGRYLKKDGTICIKVPNVDDSLLSVYVVAEYADFWYREPHIYYYSASTLKRLLQKCGFKGTIQTEQEYNFLNQMNWLFAGKPQKSATIGMSEPKLVASNAVGKRLKHDFNRWIRKVNREYIALLKKHRVAENLLFIGRKVSGRGS